MPDVKKKKAKFVLDYNIAYGYINCLRGDLIKKNQVTELFGKERGNSFDAVLGAVR